jgi:hypothetical protein
MGVLSKTFGGAASEAANSAEGRFKRLGVALEETKESVGASLMPVVEAILPVLTKFSTWAQENPKVFTIIAGAIGAVALSILAVNTAMALNPFGLIAIGIGALVTAVVIAYNKFEWFRKGIEFVVNGISDYFEFMVNAWIKAINIVIRGINLVKPGKDIGSIGSVSFGHLGGESGGGFTSTQQAEAAMFGGGVAGAAVAEATAPFLGATFTKTKDAPIVYKSEGITNDFSQQGLGAIQGISGFNITVDAGLISSPASVGQDIIDAILAAQRANGTVFAPAS